MTKTTNYQLPKWEKTDRIQMKDFNDMTATLDAALGAKAEIAFGQYTGDDTFGKENPCTLTFEFSPRAVVIVNSDGEAAVIIRPCTQMQCPTDSDRDSMSFTWLDKGLQWYAYKSATTQFNRRGYRYFYLALG